MTNTEIIQTIKAEIERQRKFIEGMFIEGDNNFYDGQDDAYNNILTFLSTLESEKPMQEGLEEEIQSFWNMASGFQPKFATLEVKENGFAVIARHFAQWGAEHSGSSETPKDLEEAAKKYATEWHKNPDGSAWKPYFEVSAIKAFIAGAKWQNEQDDKELSDLLTIAHLQGAEQMREQMLKDTVEGLICATITGANAISFLSPLPKELMVGDKVRVIILKKED